MMNNYNSQVIGTETTAVHTETRARLKIKVRFGSLNKMMIPVWLDWYNYSMVVVLVGHTAS